MAWLALPVTVVLIAISLAAWPQNSLVAAQQSDLQSSESSILLSQVFASQSNLVSQVLCAALLYKTTIYVFVYLMLHAESKVRIVMPMVNMVPMVMQGSWNALDEAGNASQQILQSKTDFYTVFAPVNTAIQAAIAKSAVTCQHDFYLDQQCTTLMQLLNSTSLPQLLQNHSKFS